MKFAVVQATYDRAPAPNTLGETTANLAAAGVFESPLLSSFSVIDSGSESLQFIYDAFANVDRGIYIATGMRSTVANVAFALRHGARMCADEDMVLFIEDDIDVCEGFLERKAAWLYEREMIMSVSTSTIAMKSEAARLLADYLATKDGDAWLAHVADWIREQKMTNLLAPTHPFVHRLESKLRATA